MKLNFQVIQRVAARDTIIRQNFTFCVKYLNIFDV